MKKSSSLAHHKLDTSKQVIVSHTLHRGTVGHSGRASVKIIAPEAKIDAPKAPEQKRSTFHERPNSTQGEDTKGKTTEGSRKLGEKKNSVDSQNLKLVDAKTITTIITARGTRNSVKETNSRNVDPVKTSYASSFIEKID